MIPISQPLCAALMSRRVRDLIGSNGLYAIRLLLQGNIDFLYEHGRELQLIREHDSACCLVMLLETVN